MFFRLETLATAGRRISTLGWDLVYLRDNENGSIMRINVDTIKDYEIHPTEKQKSAAFDVLNKYIFCINNHIREHGSIKRQEIEEYSLPLDNVFMEGFKDEINNWIWIMLVSS